ncbi:helix-turn-helix domain-containing protein [Arenibacter algicola]|uniref:helix-turn-helix domain-containing protein n=1 Tax=Arenibacter algicola TaxID=616991 RepID=UPI001C07E268|nr:helix-turn-helix domain-containing protein [Arenibacter algicola]MBU2904693.1 helix-turn-helix domain-containing protein [Arenibacter algicola]
MTHSILLQDLTPEQLGNLIDDKLASRLEQLRKQLSNQEANDNLLTRDETCKFLKVDSSTLWAWTNKGKVKAYGIGSRRYYKRSELLECLTPLTK